MERYKGASLRDFNAKRNPTIHCENHKILKLKIKIVVLQVWEINYSIKS